MASPSEGSGFIWGTGITVAITGQYMSVPTTYSNGVVGTTGIVSKSVGLSQMMMTSFQTQITSSAATVTVDIQVTNVPSASTGYRGATGPNPPVPTYRDDSFASTDWIIVSTNVMAAAVASRMDVLAYVPHRDARVRLTSSGATTSAVVYARSQGWQ